MTLKERMAESLGLPRDFIEKVALRSSHAYKRYEIPKKHGGHRTIWHPSKELKALQRWLLANVIEEWPAHQTAMAYCKGKSIWDNAVPHQISKYLLRLDLSDFFPSISAQDIQRYLETSSCDWSLDDRQFFCQLVCRQGRLTIGAPSSPALSNALCYELDVRLDSLAHSNAVIYTRYADDFFFSASKPNVLSAFPPQVQNIVESLEMPANLHLNSRKTRHSSKKGRRVVTGLVLSSDGRVAISRGIKRYIRSQLHKWDTLTPSERRSLAGLLAFLKGFEPAIMNRLILKYGYERVEQARLFLRGKNDNADEDENETPA